MKKNLLLLTIVLLAAPALCSCSRVQPEDGKPEVKWIKCTYQNIIVEEDKEEEWLEVLYEGKTEKFLLRDAVNEYAAVPDFIQKGDEIGLFYYQDSRMEMVAREITSPDLKG